MSLEIDYDDLEISGFDEGGSEMMSYQGQPFTGTMKLVENDGVVSFTAEFKNGMKTGWQREYHYPGNGALKSEYQFINNAIEGEEKEYDEQGNLTGITQWLRGQVISSKMVLAIDVYYFDDVAKAVGLLFELKQFSETNIVVKFLPVASDYVPGEFYKRELPCLLEVIGDIDLHNIELIIVDGFVYTDNDGHLGLGGHLWEALDRKIPIVGVAKNPFAKNEKTVIKVLRGESKNPLYVSAIGVNLLDATDLIKRMPGNFRIPDLLKRLDKLTKEPDLN